MAGKGLVSVCVLCVIDPIEYNQGEKAKAERPFFSGNGEGNWRGGNQLTRTAVFSAQRTIDEPTELVAFGLYGSINVEFSVFFFPGKRGKVWLVGKLGATLRLNPERKVLGVYTRVNS